MSFLGFQEDLVCKEQFHSYEKKLTMGLSENNIRGLKKDMRATIMKEAQFKCKKKKPEKDALALNNLFGANFSPGKRRKKNFLQLKLTILTI